jgi:molecular chaperone GrpE
MLIQILNMPAPSQEVQNYQIGFQMIANQLLEVLKAEGLAPIKVEKDFDPKFMEAMQTECVEGYEDNQVIRVLQAGYMYKDRVLRPALVVVNKKEIKEEKEV